MSIIDRFIEYVKIDTQSDENSETVPSTYKQYDLLLLLKKQLEELSVECEIDEHGRLYAHIPGNPKYDAIGLCSHVDTALECSGKDVKPQIITGYDLQDIPLGSSGKVLSPKAFPKLKELKGKTIITTDGTTLLGGDDKAGVSIIMDFVEKIVKTPVDSHRPISILFTPDEEIGNGADFFDKDKFGCEFAYTVDGDDPSHVEIENFNAKLIKVDFRGKSIHPGTAKGVMVNSIAVMNYFMTLLPKDMVPEKTEGREGFNFVFSIKGGVEYSRVKYLLRNHDKNLIEKQVEDFYKAKELTLKEFPNAIIEFKIRDQYRNMYEIISKNPECREHIENVYNKLNLPLVYVPTRGGTDGATFSFKGVPCPNIGTGSYNHHGAYEFAVIEEMETMVSILKGIFSI